MTIKFDNERFMTNLATGARLAYEAYRKTRKNGNIQDIENGVWNAVNCRSCAMFDAQLEDAPAGSMTYVKHFDVILDELLQSLKLYDIEDADEIELNSYQEALAQLTKFGRELNFERTKKTLEKL